MTCPKCNKEIIEADIETTKAYCKSCMEWFSIKADTTAENKPKDAASRSDHNVPQGNIMNTDKQKKKSFWGRGLIGPFELKYEEIPFYRKRWCLLLLLLFFTPAVIIIGFTGDTYALRDGKVYKYDNHFLGKLASIFVGGAIVRLIINIIFSIM